MLHGFLHRVAVLLVALGVLVAGFGPAMALPSAMAGMAKMTMMPGMQSDCVHNAQGSSKKQMPCDGTDCGCCLAGTCAAPVALDQAGLTALLGRTAEKHFGRDTVLSGITHPPALPPPIA